MQPRLRRIVYAISFEVIGIAVEAVGVLVVTDSTAGESVALSIAAATLAMVWSVTFNWLFELWERRQTRRGRSRLRRAMHALLFEGTFALLFLPLTAWWLEVTLLQAALIDAWFVAVFIVYTYVFTWAFDRLFGLPASAR